MTRRFCVRRSSISPAGKAVMAIAASRHFCAEIGWTVNKKHVERIWRCEGLKVPSKQLKRGRLWFNDGSCVRLRPERPNHVWSYVGDRTG